MPAPASVLPTPPQSTVREPIGGESLRATLADVWQLRDAWWRVKRAGGSAGPDGQTLEVFAVGLDATLEALAAALANGRYRPGLLARRILAKKDGGFRAIGVANVCDRVLQTAAGQWLQARCEPLFLPMSFGYRPHLGPQRAALYASRLAASFAHVGNTDCAFKRTLHESRSRTTRGRRQIRRRARGGAGPLSQISASQPS